MTESAPRSRLGLVVRAGTTVGRRRSNQDRFVIGGALTAVADGVGGATRGDVAAQVATGTILAQSALLAGPDGTNQVESAALVRLLQEAQEQVLRASSLLPGPSECTLSLAYVGPRAPGDASVGESVDEGTDSTDFGLTLAAAWVGDSPIFLADRTGVVEVSTRHEFRMPDGRAGLSRALGSHWAQPDVMTRHISGRTRVVLASDGIRALAEPRLHRVIADLDSPAQICLEALLCAADESGGSDNTTIAVLDVVHATNVARSHWTHPLAGA